jgi:hypothetical protein
MTGPTAGRTLLAAFFPSALPPFPRRVGMLAGEAALTTVVAAGLSLALGFREAGFVALFLVAASMTDRLMLLLEENRAAIWDAQAPPMPTNARTAASLWSIWAGVLLAYAVDAAGVGDGLGAGMGSWMGLSLHNLGVLAAVVVLSLLFRGYGTMLALSWNACVWAFVLAQHGGARLRTVAAVTPHLALEGLAYVVGGLGAVYLSQGFVRYDFGDPRLRQVLGAGARMLTLAAGLLVGAAFLEARWAPLLLR